MPSHVSFLLAFCLSAFLLFGTLGVPVTVECKGYLLDVPIEDSPLP